MTALSLLILSNMFFRAGTCVVVKLGVEAWDGPSSILANARVIDSPKDGNNCSWSLKVRTSIIVGELWWSPLFKLVGLVWQWEEGNVQEGTGQFAEWKVSVGLMWIVFVVWRQYHFPAVVLQSANTGLVEDYPLPNGCLLLSMLLISSILKEKYFFCGGVGIFCNLL